MKTKLIAVIAIVIVAVVVSALLLMQGFGTRRFTGNRFPGGNFTLNESKINEVSAVFDNAETPDGITEYCNNHRMECGYYCRSINPDHEFCSNLRDVRNTGGV